MHKPCKPAYGFSLIEVLVSIIIISLGILGISGLLVKGMSNAKTASLRTTAAMQASSLANAIYANRAFWAKHTQAVSFQSTGATVSNPSSNIDTSKASCGSCTPAQLAGLDIKAWVDSLNTALPGAKSDVSCPQTTNDTAHNCTIKISWTERFMDSGKTTTPASANAESVATSGDRSYFLHIEP